jgi:hypothetical protein
MLELVRSHNEARLARSQAQWEELDEVHAAIWQAIRHLFPARAMVDQTDYGLLVVSWPLREPRRTSSHFAAPVMIRIEPGLLLALWTCDGDGRRDIANLQARIVEDGLEAYDPHSRVPRCGVIVLGH